jgi:uncharacterized SAM-binding protein YcdF (DUF218 family)
MRTKYKWLALTAFFLFAAVITYQQTGFFDDINENLLLFLTSTDELPQNKVFDAVYILGGNQESLKAKYKKAASIYIKGWCKEIIILSRPGITEYNISIRRNLTNDEWSRLILEGLGVSGKDVRTMVMEPGFFGTYTESKNVSKMIEENGWKSLLLITSPHHTKRVKKCFAHFIDGTAADFYVAAPEYKVSLTDSPEL